jgi:hypothetical protein
MIAVRSTLHFTYTAGCMRFLFCYVMHLVREDTRFRALENKMLWRISGTKRAEERGKWRKLHGELNNLHSYPNNVRSLNNSVEIHQGLIPGRDKRFFSSPQHPDRLWGPSSDLSNGYRGLFPRG